MGSSFKYLVILLLAGLSVIASLVMRSGDDDWSRERTRALKQIGQSSTSLRLSLENLTEKTANELTRIVEVEMTSAGLTHWLGDSAFQAVFLVGKAANGTWNVDWTKSKSGEDLGLEFKTWIPKLPLARIQGETLSWNRVERGSKKTFLLLGVQLKVKENSGESLKLAFGLLPLNYLSSLTSPLKAEGEEVFLVDSAGYALTFPDPAYVGSQLDVHPIVSDLKRNQSLNFYGDYKNLTGDRTVGGFEKAVNSNVYVVNNQRVDTRLGAAWGQLQSAIMAFGILGLFLLITFFMVRRDEKSREQLSEILRNSSDDEPVEIDTRSLEDERKKLFEQLGLTFLSHLRGPIYSSLGKVHQMQNEAKEEKSKAHLNFLEGEVRKVRDFVEGLGQVFDLKDKDSQSLDLAKLVDTLLPRYKKLWDERGITVELKSHSNAQVRMNSDDLDFILRTLMEYACYKANFSGEQRRVQLGVERTGPLVRFVIHLVGAKTSELEAKRLFQVRDPNQLELSFAQGMAVSWNGHLKAEASMAGTRLIFEVPGVDLRAEAGQVKTPVIEASFGTSSTETTSEDPPVVVDEEVTSFESQIVRDQLGDLLPPKPEPDDYDGEVTVVEELTATSNLPQSKSVSVEVDSEVEKSVESPPSVKIRKPKVRYDV